MPLTKGEIEQTSGRLAEARKACMETENLYKKVRSMGDSVYTSVEIIPKVFADPVVQALKQKQEEISRKLSELSQRYGSEHPQMLAARSEFESVNRQQRQRHSEPV